MILFLQADLTSAFEMLAIAISQALCIADPKVVMRKAIKVEIIFSPFGELKVRPIGKKSNKNSRKLLFYPM
tara:strand:+ start:232 stop:444 length:213 start_codon:yes stop_codon:yes gene_type:complete